MAETRLEDHLKRLSEIVRTLEQNEAPLEDSLKLFEEGVGLVRACHIKLSDAEKKIDILTKSSAEGVETRPYGNNPQ